jgi:hypothetical protein
MDVNVFVSSTCRDMEQDCRPAVLEAIRYADDILKEADDGRASAVAMEDWDADYEPAMQLCLEKIRAHSTHYLGVLGYLRGFVPAGENAASITEVEWGCAVEHCGQRRMAIFVPKDHSEMAVELERRAAGRQSDAERDAQLMFLARVLHEGTAQQFTNVPELHGRVMRKIVSWGRGGIRETARAARSGDDTGPRRRIPGASDLIRIGRREHLTAFLDTVQALSAPGTGKAVAFLVHGPYGFGHQELMTRLAHVMDEHAFAQPRRCVISAAALWRESSCPGLIDAIGREIFAGWRPAHIRDLATGLMAVLNDRDVIVQASGLEGYVGGPEAFLDEFWRPLAGQLVGQAPNRLICLASVETADISATTALPDRGPPVDGPYAGLVHVLPPLRPFTETELSFWLKSWLTAAEADYWSGKLMARTQGMPQALYAVLADPALWEQPAAEPALTRRLA